MGSIQNVVKTFPLFEPRRYGFLCSMYLRPIWTKRKAYWALVKSVRMGNKVRQEVVAYLGALNAKGKAKAQALARNLGLKPDQPELFDPPLKDEIVPVHIKGVSLERARQFGDVYLGMKLWQMAGFDQFFSKHLPVGQEDIPWSTMAMISTIARLCNPSSELHIAEHWIRQTALCDMLLVNEEKINEDRLYRVLDEILPLKAKLETHLKSKWETLFETGFDLMLYDITSVYFEGEARGNPQAQRGYSRDHRPDCKQVCLGLVVTKEGLPVGYEIFPGNTHDSKTVKMIVTTMESRYGKSQRIWVWDRGMLQADLIPWMQEGGRRYVMALPKSTVNKYVAALENQKNWQSVKNRDIEVQYVTLPDPDSTDLFVLCRSQRRRQKENGMHVRFMERIESSLQRMNRRLKKAKKKVPMERVQRQIGRILERHQRGAKFFEIVCEPDTNQSSGMTLHWKKMDNHAAQKMEGCYLLRTNIPNWSAADIWQLYIQLTQVEAAFRVHKSQLEIRPVYHQKQERVQSHILVCFLAYSLWKLLEQWQSQASLGHSPRTILNEFAHIQSADVHLPTATGELLKFRCVIRPEKHQQILLQRLGIQIPQRMNSPKGVKM